jgi:hypothetical protein
MMCLTSTYPIGVLAISIPKNAFAVKSFRERGSLTVTDKERIAQLDKEIAELQARLPKHSVPAAMIIELEDLEDELEALRAQVARDAA